MSLNQTSGLTSFVSRVHQQTHGCPCIPRSRLLLFSSRRRRPLVRGRKGRCAAGILLSRRPSAPSSGFDEASREPQWRDVQYRFVSSPCQRSPRGARTTAYVAGCKHQTASRCANLKVKKLQCQGLWAPINPSSSVRSSRLRIKSRFPRPLCCALLPRLPARPGVLSMPGIPSPGGG